MFNKSTSRNQLGFNIGASVADVLIPYLSLNAEYTRVNPFVYRNLNPAQNYTNHSYYIGDWMGNNFDRIILSANYTPVAKLKCLLRYQYIRKGGAGTLDQPDAVTPDVHIFTRTKLPWVRLPEGARVFDAIYSALSPANLPLLHPSKDL